MRVRLSEDGCLINPFTGDTVWFHGSNESFDDFDSDIVWVAASEDEASEYGDMVYDVVIRPPESALVFDATHDLFDKARLPSAEAMGAFVNSFPDMTSPGEVIDEILTAGERHARRYSDLWAALSTHDAIGVGETVHAAYKTATAGYSPLELFALQLPLAYLNYTAVQLLFGEARAAPIKSDCYRSLARQMRPALRPFFGWLEHEFPSDEQPSYVAVRSRFCEVVGSAAAAGAEDDDDDGDEGDGEY